MKRGLRNETAEKWLNNGDFQVVSTLPYIFHSLFQEYGEVLQRIKFNLQLWI